MSAIPTDIEGLSSTVAEVAEAVSQAYARCTTPSPGRTEPQAIRAALDRFLEVARRVDAPPRTDGLSAAEVTELGEHGLTLLEGLDGWVEELGLVPDRAVLDRVFPGLAVWLARRGAELGHLEPVVNALARLANRTFEPAELAALCDRMGEVLGAASPVVRADLDDASPGRPWRVLNINRGIVATRSHDPERMERAFEDLTRNLPRDAPQFFREGMGQMEALSYPAHVRAVMERYYRTWSARTVH